LFSIVAVALFLAVFKLPVETKPDVAVAIVENERKRTSVARRDTVETEGIIETNLSCGSCEPEVNRD